MKKKRSNFANPISLSKNSVFSAIGAAGLVNINPKNTAIA